jgi:multiple sugar transport system permease protein
MNFITVGDIKMSKPFRVTIYYFLAISVSLIFILPLFWMISASLRLPGMPPPRSIEWIPSPISWENYQTIFEILPLGKYVFNSLFVSLVAIPVTLLVSSLAGFGMSQLRYKERKLLLALNIGLLALPITALWLTRYILFSWFGITDSYLALLAPAFMGTSPLFILLFYWTFHRIPAEIIESARLDGADVYSIWWRIALPQAIPAVIVVSILTFMYNWNDFINPMLYLRSQNLYTLAVGLQQLQQLDKTNWPLLIAASVVMTLPPVLLLLFLQRYFFSDEQLDELAKR